MDALEQRTEQSIETAAYRTGVISSPTANINAVENGRFRVDGAGIVKEAAQNYWGMKYSIPVTPSTGYTWNIFDHGASATISYDAAWYGEDGAFLDKETFDRQYGSPSVATTSPSGAYYLCISAHSNNGL